MLQLQVMDDAGLQLV